MNKFCHGLTLAVIAIGCSGSPSPQISGQGGGGSAATGGVATGGTATNIGGKASGGTGASAGGSGGATGAIRLPTANAGFDYQLGGAYAPPAGVTVVGRDRNDTPASGLYNICYINGFQIQTDEESFWTTEHPDLILRDSSGNPVVDPNWNEMLLDTSTAVKRSALATVLGTWITKCATDGFNAVEFDNLDSYSRSNGLLSQANNIAMMALLSSTSHTNGLAVGQKNATELLGSASTMGTDFEVAEECNRYSECDSYKAVYGNLVFDIEYRTQDFQTGCSQHPELSIILRDIDLSPAGSTGYVYQGC